MSFSPTQEQQAILAAFATGQDMVVEAGAGTGKTSTLRLLGESAPERTGLYLAYNKAIQKEAEGSFPSNVTCRTAHSLAYRAVGKNFRNRLNGARVTSRQMVDFLGIPFTGFSQGEIQIAPWQVASLVLQGVGKFCNSADTEITKFHMPRLDGAEEVQDELDTFLLPFARKAWDDLQKPAGSMRFTHDTYLKIWALTNPVIEADFILFDEAQDANPVIAGVVAAQSATTQTVFVGDRNQAIYGWRGAVDAMSTFEGTVLPLSQSFRFGPAIAEEANKLLSILNSDLRISGFEPVPSTVGTVETPDAILCRTNAQVIMEAMDAHARGLKVAIVGGTGEIKKFAEASIELMAGKGTRHPDLMAFDSWTDLQVYAKSDEGRDLRVMVSLIDEHGPQAIIDIADASVNEGQADLIVSTAHKAKGREWDTVRIAPDFKAPEEGELSRPEAMLIYVAVTRAKITLDRSGVAWVDGLVAGVVA
jgi:superfamily I DNA/RNA helicase